MIIETALVELAKAGGTELFLSSSESLLKKVKTAKDIKQLFINTCLLYTSDAADE